MASEPKEAQEYSLRHYASHPMECSSMEEDDGGPWIKAEDYAGLLLAAREMREVLREVEWVTHQGVFQQWSQCPCCDNERSHSHAPDCRLARLIGGGE